MMVNAQSAIVDNDFVGHLVESKLSDERLVAILQMVFSDLALNAVMHPLVYEKELLVDSKRITLLFQNGVINKAEFADIFQEDPAKKAYYLYLVTELFASLTGETFPVSGDAILTHWVRQQSLGEVHSLSMCLVCGCGIFLSDDNDAKALKTYIDQKSLGTVTVYNRSEFISKHMVESEHKLDRRERRSLTHSLR